MDDKEISNQASSEIDLLKQRVSRLEEIIYHMEIENKRLHEFIIMVNNNLAQHLMDHLSMY